MRDAGDARPLVARADPEEMIQSTHWQRRIAQQADLQAVVERVLLDGKVLRGQGHQSSRGFMRICSAGVSSFLRLLHSLHAATTLPRTLRPPRATGTTWSMVSSRRVTDRPQ